MTPVTLTKVLPTASAAGICKGQTLAAAGNLTLDGTLVSGGVADLGTQRRVAFISAGDDSKATATLYGTREGGAVINEALPLTNKGTATTVLDFLNVATIAVDSKIASTVTVGTSGTGSTPWIMPNFHLTPFDLTLNTELTGSVTYNLETTQDDYWTPPRSNYDVTPQPNVYEVVQGATAAAVNVLNTAVTGYRLTITSGTGTLAAQGTQAGISNY